MGTLANSLPIADAPWLYREGYFDISENEIEKVAGHILSLPFAGGKMAP